MADIALLALSVLAMAGTQGGGDKTRLLAAGQLLQQTATAADSAAYLALVLDDASPLPVVTAAVTDVAPSPSPTPCRYEPTPRPGPANPTSPPEPRPPDDVFAGCSVVEEEDYYVDGSVENRRFIVYNDRGDKLTHITDSGADGVMDFVATWAYDRTGRLVLRTRDHGNDGVLEYIDTYSYDGRGNIRRHETRDGAGALLDATEYEYDALEHLVREVFGGPDGEAITIESYEYDAVGHRTRATTVGGDGSLQFIDALTWSGDVIVRHDTVFQSGLTLIAYLAYDEARRMVLREADNLGDGSIETRIEWRHERHGWVDRREKFVMDQMAETTAYTYDCEGRVTEQLSRGALIVAVKRTYTCDS